MFFQLLLRIRKLDTKWNFPDYCSMVRDACLRCGADECCLKMHEHI